MRELLSAYDLLIKKERCKYFTNITAAKKCNSRVLFNTIDPSTVWAFSVEGCDNFLACFARKVKVIKASITPPTVCITPPDAQINYISEESEKIDAVFVL